MPGIPLNLMAENVVFRLVMILVNLHNGSCHFVSFQGHYINIDFFLSRMRTLARHLNKNEPIKTMFNRSHTV